MGIRRWSTNYAYISSRPLVTQPFRPVLGSRSATSHVMLLCLDGRHDCAQWVGRRGQPLLPCWSDVLYLRLGESFNLTVKMKRSYISSRPLVTQLFRPVMGSRLATSHVMILCLDGRRDCAQWVGRRGQPLLPCWSDVLYLRLGETVQSNGQNETLLYK
jgi:hypothetical protein